MSLNLEQKKAVVAEVAEVAASAHSAVAAEYSGLSVEEMTELRVQARGAGVHLRVVKNTLARRALEGTDFDCMRERLTGPLLLAFSQDDSGSAARVIRNFSKDHDRLVPRLVALGGQLLEGTEIERVAKLPTYDEAVSLLMAVMKAPIEKLARTVNEVPGKLVRTVAAVRDQKQSA